MPATQYAGKRLNFLGQQISVGSFLGASGGTQSIIAFNEERPEPFCMLDYVMERYPNFTETYYDPDLDETVTVPVNSKFFYFKRHGHESDPNADIVFAFGFRRSGDVAIFNCAVSRGEWESSGPGGSTTHPAVIIQPNETPDTYPPNAYWIPFYGEFCPSRGMEFYGMTVPGRYAGVPVNYGSLSDAEKNFHRMIHSLFFWAPAVEGDPEYGLVKYIDMYQHYGRTICYTPDDINSWGGYAHNGDHAPFFPYDVMENSAWLMTTLPTKPLTNVGSFTPYNNNIQPWNGPTVYEPVYNATTGTAELPDDGITPMSNFPDGPDSTFWYDSTTVYSIEYNRLAEGRFASDYAYCPLDCGQIIDPDNPEEPVDPTPPSDPEPPPDEGDPKDTGFDGENDKGRGTPPIEVTDTGMWQLYTPTTTQLRSFNAWLWSDNYKTAIQEWGIQPLEQIVMFGMVPFKVASSGTSEVYMAGKGTGLNMNVATSMWYYKDLGWVDVYGPTKSFLDHTSVTYTLFLPWVGFVPLKANEIMWGQLGIEVYANIITGDLVYNVFVNPSKTGLKQTLKNARGHGCLSYTYTGNCLMNLPISNANYGAYYAQKRNDVFGIMGDLVKGIGGGIAAGAMSGGGAGAVIGGIAGGIGSIGSIANHVTSLESSAPEVQRSGALGGSLAFLGYNKPYLLCNQPQWFSSGYYDFYSIQTRRGDKPIGEYSGWIFCSKVNNTVTLTNTGNSDEHGRFPITDEEKQMITELLQTGIYIK